MGGLLSFGTFDGRPRVPKPTNFVCYISYRNIIQKIYNQKVLCAMVRKQLLLKGILRMDLLNDSILSGN